MRLAYGFACGFPVKPVAAGFGVSQKTVRAFYLDCRAHLSATDFRRWHRLSLINPVLPDDALTQALPKIVFFEVMAACHDNETCHRNYRLGNRKSRFCRACPIKEKFTQRLREVDAIRVIDAVQTFYRHLGLRRETGVDPVANLRQRLLHLSVITAIRAHSTQCADGSPNPADMSYEGLGSFLILLIDRLAVPSIPPP